MTLALLREIIDKQNMTESYQIMPVFMREINGTYVTELQGYSVDKKIGFS